MKSNAQTTVSWEEKQKMWLSFLLAGIAGFADAFGFLALQKIFFSAVSGNTVAVNASLAKKDWREAVHHACPIIFFAGGVILGTIIEKAMCRRRIRRRLAIASAIEALLLAAFLIVGHEAGPFNSSTAGVRQEPVQFYLMIALLSGAMGVQAATLRRVGQESVNTPFVTGMLVQAVENAVNAGFNAFDRFRNRKSEFADDAAAKAIFHGALWLCFAVGAFGGGAGEIRWGYPALLAPIGALSCIIFYDLARPVRD